MTRISNDFYRVALLVFLATACSGGNDGPSKDSGASGAAGMNGSPQAGAAGAGPRPSRVTPQQLAWCKTICTNAVLRDCLGTLGDGPAEPDPECIEELCFDNGCTAETDAFLACAVAQPVDSFICFAGLPQIDACQEEAAVWINCYQP